jgi:hypothetical protein
MEKLQFFLKLNEKNNNSMYALCSWEGLILYIGRGIVVHPLNFENGGREVPKSH